MNLVAAVHGLKSVTPRRRIAVRITPYELRVAPEDRPHGTRKYGRDATPTAVVVLARTTSGHGVPRWLERAAQRINEAAVTSVADARAIVDECYAARCARREPAARPVERLIPVGWTAEAPITPEETLRAAGIDDARQAAYHVGTGFGAFTSFLPASSWYAQSGIRFGALFGRGLSVTLTVAGALSFPAASSAVSR